MITKTEYEKLWELIKPVKAGMLTTWTGQMIHARPMQHVNENLEEGILYFFTNAGKGKAEEMERYEDICITYANHQTSKYVSISATAEVVHDKELINKYWNMFVSAWFPEGKDSPDLRILKIHPYAAEYWDSPESKMVQLFKIVKANVTSTMPDMGTNRRFS